MLKRVTQVWAISPARSAMALTGLFVLVALLAACGSGLSSATSSNAGAGKIVITGAINNSYTPAEVTAVKINTDIGISMHEEFPCGVAVQFPIDIAPGAYPMGDPIKQFGDVVVSGEYNTPTCQKGGSLSDTFRSTKGTLTLTAAGDKFSGTFEFTAAKMNDPSKTIHVTGSFKDASLQ